MTLKQTFENLQSPIERGCWNCKNFSKITSDCIRSDCYAWYMESGWIDKRPRAFGDHGITNRVYLGQWRFNRDA